MAEITKITTPMMPKENTSIKHKPATDQAFELTDPSKVHKQENEGQINDRQPDTSTLLKESMGRPAIAPLLKNPGDMMQIFKKIAFLVEMGVSASDAAKDASTKELLDSLFVSPKEVAGVLEEQDKSSVLFKGEAFDVLRDIAGNFKEYPKVKDSVVNLLKIFDRNVTSQNSVKTILYNCNNLLDYMFSRDKSQFANYIKELAQILLPKEEAAAFIKNMPDVPSPQQSQVAAQQENPQITAQGDLQGQIINDNNTQNLNSGQNAQDIGAQQNPGQNQAAVQGEIPAQAQGGAEQTQAAEQQAGQTGGMEQQARQASDPLNQDLNLQRFGDELHQAARQPANQAAGQAGNAAGQQLTPKETAGILKNNLLPLLSEMVVKYNQSDKMRDLVMVVVHNIVRADKGTPEALENAVSKLTKELREVATLPKAFERQLLEELNQSVKDVKEQPNTVMSKMTDIVSEALRSQDTNPAVLRQAENMLISMLQNQSSMMDVLHFIIPFQTPQGQVFSELYVDPETDESVGRQKGQSRKIFLSVETEAHGSFELSFLETGEHIDFAMWAPEDLVQGLSGLKRSFANIMQLHGYTMNTFKIDEMKAPHTVAEVFPRLIEKKVGIDINA